jgi:hypothetical protein
MARRTKPSSRPGECRVVQFSRLLKREGGAQGLGQQGVIDQ